MTHFFEKKDPWGNGMALWVLVLMAFLTPLAVYAVKQVKLQNNVEDWLPHDDPQAMILAWYHRHFPESDTVLVSWEGASLQDPRVEAFAEALTGTIDEEGLRRGGVGDVAAVTTPRDVIRMMAAQLKATPGDEATRAEIARRLEGVLIGPGSLKIRLTPAGLEQKEQTLARLTELARGQLDVEPEISDPLPRPPVEPLPPLPENLPPEQEPEWLLERTVDEVARLPWQPHDLQITWQGLLNKPRQREEFQQLAAALADDDGQPLVAESFFIPGAPVALYVHLKKSESRSRSRTIDDIRAAAEEVGISPDGLRMGGGPVTRQALNQAVKQVLWAPQYSWLQFYKLSPFLLSAVVGTLLSFLLVGNIRLSILVFAVSLFTMLTSTSLVPVTGGSMNMVLVVMPTLLMVLTFSAGIHLSNYWKHAAIKDSHTAVVNAVRAAAAPCLLASVTTAIGLASLASSPLVPVRDFGIYSGVGCIISLVVVLGCMPALMQVWPGQPPRLQEINTDRWYRLGLSLSRGRWIVYGFGLLLLAAGLYGLQYFRTETKAIKYFPQTARVYQDYEFLEKNLSGIIPVHLVVMFHPDQNTGQSGDGKPQPDFLQRMEIVRGIQEKMRAHPEISGCISLTDFQPVIHPPQPGAGPVAFKKYLERNKQAELRIKEEPAARSFLSVAREAEPGLHESGAELWKITAQVAILSDLDYTDLTHDLNEIARTELQNYPGTNYQVSGMVPVFLRTQQAVLESLIVSFGMAFVLIAGVMIVLLRNIPAGLLTMLPNIVPIVVVFGLVAWADIPVDIGTMITASVALGIAVDGTLHLITWFQHAIKSGATREEAVARSLAHCGPAMWQTSVIIGLGLLMLMFTDILLISRFGWLMSALVFAALVADAILSPALLAGGLGALIERTIRRTEARASQTQDSPAESVEGQAA